MGKSLVVQWLGPHSSTAGGPGSIPGQGTKILQATDTPPPPQNYETQWTESIKPSSST